jgi:hypothetical protein
MRTELPRGYDLIAVEHEVTVQHDAMSARVNAGGVTRAASPRPGSSPA